MFRETVVGRRRFVHRQRSRAGHLPGLGGAAGLQEDSSARTCASKSARPRASTSTMAVGALEETITVTAESPIVDVTSKEIGGNITSDTLVKLPSVNGNFVGFVGLLPGIVPSISTESFGSDFDRGQRPGSAQQQLHARRRQQQRRRHRAARRHAGADADRGDPGIPGHHRPVRRAVRPHLRRGRQRGHQVGHQPASRSVAFGFVQNGNLTTKDFFVRQTEGPRSRTRSYQRWGGTIGGPIVKDKIHFFGSLERFSIDRPNTINIPVAAGSQRHRSSPQDRVWNTIIRGDHQVNNNNTYSVRWLREQSPQVQPDHPAGTQVDAPAAAREESDVDQTLSISLNSVLSNTKVSTLRVTWTRENVTFANNCFNTNGRDLSQCPVTLALPGLHRPAGQHRAGAHQRRHPGRRDARLVPAGQARRSRHQVRRAVPVLGRLQHQPGQPERHLLVRPQQRRRSTPPIPSTYPGPPDDSRRRAEHVLREGALHLRLRAGQVAHHQATSRSTSACATTSR